MNKIYIDLDKLTPEYRQRFYQHLEDKISDLEAENKSLKDKLDKGRIIGILVGKILESKKDAVEIANEIIENPEKGL